MSSASSASAYTSANHRKYTSGFSIYDRHVASVIRHVGDLLNATEPQTVLDAGCGEGFAIHLLSDSVPGVKFTGVDISPEAIAYAQEHFGDDGTFRTGSVYKLPFSDRAFDTVICCEVLEHIDDPAAAIKELKRVARNYVVISVPREPYFDWLNMIAQKLRLSLDPGHVNFWTKKDFIKYMRHHFEKPEFGWKHLYQFMVARV